MPAGSERAPAAVNGRGARECGVKPRAHDSALHAEQALLGALLMGGTSPPAGLQPGHFNRTDHRSIFAGILAAVADGAPTDVITVAELMEADGALLDAGGLSYLVELANNTPGPIGIEHWAQSIRDAHRRRRAAEIGADLAAGADPGEAVARLLALGAGDRDLTPIDLSDLATAEPPPVRWCVEGLIPAGNVTLLGGHGGAGKSLLALTLAGHVATGRSWAGYAIEPGRALFLSLEDEAELVRWRLKRIADEYALPVAQLAEGVTVVCPGDVHCALMVQADGYPPKARPTAAMAELAELARGHALVVIDGASDAFDADENRRRDVRAFLRELVRIARDTSAALVLLAHIDKAAARYGSNGQSFSGSTAWHNSARSRLALVREDDRLELRHEKSNHGRLADPVALRWAESGVPLPVSVQGPEAREADAAADDAELLKALRKAAAEGRSITTAEGGRTAWHILRDSGDLSRLANNKDRYWRAVERLRRSGRIVAETYRDEQRKQRARWRVESVSAEEYRRTRDGE